MRDQLRLHTLANLKFYLRSRLILGVGLAALGIWAIGLVPVFLFDTAGSRFEQLKYIAAETTQLAWLAAAALGLFAVSSHLRSHSARLVFTRPASRESWLAGVFVSALLVALAIQVAGGMATALLALVWGVPVQTGFLFLTMRAAFETMIVVSLLTALGTALHPVIAVVLVAFFNDHLLLILDTWLLGTVQAGRGGVLVRGAEWLARGIYNVLPILSPFADRTEKFASSLRVTPADWAYLAATAGYALLVSVFFFLLASFIVRRKSFI